MHKFIFKFEDVDKKKFEEIYDALFTFYGFLAQKKVVASINFTDFKSELNGMRKELLGKIERYNAIRHDPEMAEEEKEETRDELFEGDHFWPNI